MAAAARHVPQIKFEAETSPGPVSPSVTPPREVSTTARITHRPPPKPRAASVRSAPPTAESLRALAYGSSAVKPDVPSSVATFSSPEVVPTVAPEPIANKRPATKPSMPVVKPTHAPAREVPRSVAPSPAARPSPMQNATASSKGQEPLPKPEPIFANAAIQSPALAAGKPPEPAETAGSLFPSVTSIYPDMPVWRKSRRPLVVASGAVVALAAIFVFLASAPKKSNRAHPVAASLAVAASSETPSVKIAVPSNLPELASEPMPVAQTTKSPEPLTTAVSRKPSKRSAAPSTDVSASGDALPSSRKQARESEPSVASRHSSEPKSALVETSSTSKVTASNSKKDRGNPSSVASWDQGTAEHRAWMNPGF